MTPDTPQSPQQHPVPQDHVPAEKKRLRQRLAGLWRMEGTTPRRRLLVRSLTVLALVSAFVVVPLYVALQPSFVQRYPNLAPEYKTWSTSVHAQVPCQRCHVPPQALPQVVYAVRMLGEFYVSLAVPGRQPQIYQKPVNSACQSCHVDLRTVSPAGDLNIPHRAHVDALKMQCVQCHRYLVHEPNPVGRHTPWMATCLKCHDGKTAKDGCATCHTAKALPASHRRADWVVVHPQMQGTIDCKRCHAWTKDWCRECHTHRPADHGADWRTQHGVAVKTRRNCEACHTAEFCTRCHGAVPQLNFRPDLKFVQ